jgi:hypothetical protein
MKAISKFNSLEGDLDHTLCLCHFQHKFLLYTPSSWETYSYVCASNHYDTQFFEINLYSLAPDPKRGSSFLQCPYVDIMVLLNFRSVEMKRSIVQDGQNAAMFVVQHSLFCDIYRDLSPRQHNICRNNLLLMGSVIEGARLARKECIKQFSNERWDCSSISGKSTALGLMTKYGKCKTSLFFSHFTI